MARDYSYEPGRVAAPVQRIFISVPSYDGKMEPQCLFSILHGMELLWENGIACGLHLHAGDCHVDDARNGVVREFLNTEGTDLVFVDADVGFPAENLLRLVQHDADVVAGVYPKKGDPEFPVWPLPGLRDPTLAGLVEVEGAPTGFMRIRRAVLEKFEKAFKHRQFYGQGQTEGRPYTIIFERLYEAGHRWSGDYGFCRKWRVMGGKIYVDPEMEFEHVGPNAWKGRLGDHWRREIGQEPVRFIEAMGRLKAGDPKFPEDFVTLHEAWGNPWAASPGFLIAAYSMAKNAKGPVLETGSGLSTLVMAAAGAKVTSLEHDLGWYRKITGLLRKYGLADSGVQYVRLDKYDGWYCWEPTQDYCLLVLDGPPRQENWNARAHALSLPAVQNADWLIDDAESIEGRPFELVEGEKPFVIAKRAAVEQGEMIDG